MAAEMIGDDLLQLTPGPFDPHGHPRIFDRIVPDNFIPMNNGEDGKAGLNVYTRAALLSGFTGMIAMTNEMGRRFTGITSEHTELIPYPVMGLDRQLAAEFSIGQESVIPMGYNLCLDPKQTYTPDGRVDGRKLDSVFREASGRAMGLKIFGDISNGGFNIDPLDIPDVTRIWHYYNAESPVTLHLEDSHVALVLEDIANIAIGKEIAINIAHVSSRQELEAVIEAKKAGMNVWCEVTPHHLFLTEDERETQGGYGCMKPTLKKQEDIDFLWANIDYIDFFGSDCAPHRVSDKEAANPTFGVTNHTVMLPLLLGAVRDGKLTMDQLYKKLCVNVRERFGLPLDDNSTTVIKLDDWQDKGSEYHHSLINPAYANTNPFVRGGNRPFPFIGRVAFVRAGLSTVKYLPGIRFVPHGFDIDAHPSLSHLIRPESIDASIKYWQHTNNTSEGLYV